MASPLRVRARRARPGERVVRVVIEGGGAPHVLDGWEQGLAPHELVHAAVERVFALRGFVRLAAQGLSPAQQLRLREPEALWAEALTNAFQAEALGALDGSHEQLEAYLAQTTDETTRAGRSVDRARAQEARALVAELSRRWRALGPGEWLELELEAAPAGR